MVFDVPETTQEESKKIDEICISPEIKLDYKMPEQDQP